MSFSLCSAAHTRAEHHSALLFEGETGGSSRVGCTWQDVTAARFEVGRADFDAAPELVRLREGLATALCDKSGNGNANQHGMA